jgi:hypothetical protein
MSTALPDAKLGDTAEDGTDGNQVVRLCNIGGGVMCWEKPGKTRVATVMKLVPSTVSATAAWGMTAATAVAKQAEKGAQARRSSGVRPQEPSLDLKLADAYDTTAAGRRKPTDHPGFVVVDTRYKNNALKITVYDELVSKNLPEKGSDLAADISEQDLLILSVGNKQPTDYNGTVDIDGHTADRRAARAANPHARSHTSIDETLVSIRGCLKGGRGRWKTVSDWIEEHPDEPVLLDLFRRHTNERARLERHSSWHMASKGGGKLQAGWPNIRDVDDFGTGSGFRRQEGHQYQFRFTGPPSLRAAIDALEAPRWLAQHMAVEL